MDNLVEVTSGISSASFVVDGISYQRFYGIDDRFNNMEPLVCFRADLSSSTPSMAPTMSPTMVKVAKVQALQVRYYEK